jgi:hypothetical protein
MHVENFVVTVLNGVFLFALGVAAGQWIVPIPWKFPNWSRQIVVNKIACSAVIVCAVSLCAYYLLKSQNFL